MWFGERGEHHAGMSKEEHTAIEKWFFSATDAVLVATTAYGMGVDKPHIRCVYRDDQPCVSAHDGSQQAWPDSSFKCRSQPV